MSENREAESESAGRRVSPGERLRTARIEQGMTLEELANQMRLSAGILESLEENRFEDITAPIFVKGYLRSYARIVGIDEAEILDLYVNEYMDSDPPINSTSSDRAQRRRVRSGARGRWWLVLLIVAVALGGWWYQRSQQDAQAISLDAAAEPSEDRNVTTAETPVAKELAGDAERQLEQLEPVTENTIPEETAAAPGATEVERTNTSPEPSVAPLPVPATTETPAPEREPEQEPAMTIETTEAAPPAQTVAEPESGTKVEAAVAGEPGGSGLSLHVSADTWADIRDATGRKLVYTLLRAGHERKIDGQAPLRLFFGNGHGVELIWKGKPVDLSSRIRADNTVRLTLE